MVRPAWSTVPAPVRVWAEQALGSPVVSAVTQPGGWSPGIAARLTCADGRRAFVKAVDEAVNAQTAALHRREARAGALLAGAAGSPRMLTSYDDLGWVALLFEQVEGRPPASPWCAAELDAALALLEQIDLGTTPCPLPLEQVGTNERFDGWAQLASDGTVLTPWEARHLDRLVALEASWPRASEGTTLLHTDVRADNLLLRPDGSAVLVDWPGASIGAATVDLVVFAPSVALDGGPPPEQLLRRTTAGRAADPDAVTAQVVAFGGYLQHRRRQPPPPGIATLRDFQAAQGDVVLDWLRARTGWR